MRHQKRGRKLNRTASHRKAMLANMVTSLFAHERIETTTPKAKELRRVADRMVTLAKAGTLHARRQAAVTIKEGDVLAKLFGELAERYATRPGGYTRVLHTRVRRGDNAPMSLVELVDAPAPVVEVMEETGDDEAAEDAEETQPSAG